jgi:DNA modification methylase
MSEVADPAAGAPAVGVAHVIEMWPLERLRPYPRNARVHSAEQIAQIARSIEQWGFTIPVLVDESGMIIAGHGRVEAAKLLGMLEVPVIVARGWTDAQKRAYAIADNRLNETSEWDKQLLRLELGDLRDIGFDLDLIGFDLDDLHLLGLGAEDGDPDAAPEIPEYQISRAGDLWVLGRHRLLCGDATSKADVDRLLLDGTKPKLLTTDPPFGVSLDMEWRDRAGHNDFASAAKSYMKSRDRSLDTKADWSDAFALAPSLEVAYVWHASSHLIEVGLGLERIGFELRQQIIWDKMMGTISRQAYNWQHEPCWYAVRKGKTARWHGTNDQTTIWNAASPKQLFAASDETKYDHPTQKPVVLYTRPIQNHTEIGDAVYEPFSGSGTAIAACEMTGRCCVAMEIEPRFVDVACRRWEQLSGLKAILAGDGRSFAEIARQRAAGADANDGAATLAGESEIPPVATAGA